MNLESISDGAADILYGGAGNDFLWGGGGNDILYGQTDNDTLTGGNNDDTLLGGDGDDKMTGDYGKAFYDSGSGAVIQGNDYLDGGLGNDWMQGEGGDDELFGGTGNDQMWGDAWTYNDSNLDGNDYLDGEEGDDQLVGQGGDDQIFGGADDDQLFGDSDSTPDDKHGNDYLDGEGGNDSLRGHGGDDDMFGGEGTDLLLGDAGDDYLDGEDGDDELQGGEGNDQLEGGDGEDLLFGNAGDDILSGGQANDELQGGDGNDWLEGGSGGDALFGDGGNDTLTGGGGVDDYLNGGDGDDTYILDDQDVGMTTIEDGSGMNRIIFGTGIRPQDLSFIPIPGASDFILRYGDDMVGIKDGLTSAAISHFEFSDGQVLTRADIMALAPAPLTIQGGDNSDDIVGGSHADDIRGGAGADLITGGAHNDLLKGGQGDDTYFFRAGDGTDTIDDHAGVNRIRFGAGITAEDIHLSVVELWPGHQLRVRYGDEDDVVALQNGVFRSTDIFEFADGTVLTVADLMLRSGPVTASGSGDGSAYGSNFDDVLRAGGGEVQIYGRDGNDTLIGTYNNNIISGGNGNDAIEGGGGGDVLSGGAGDDYLSGSGHVTYLFNVGDGQDIISNSYSRWEESQVVFGAGLDAASVQVSQAIGEDGNVYLDLDFGNGDRLSIIDGAMSGVRSFAFADGTVLSVDELVKRAPNVYFGGTDYDDQFTGGGGDDQLYGSNGQDVLAGGQGNDTLSGGNHNDVLNGGDGNDVLDGGYDNDTLSGGEGNDQLIGGLGDDVLQGNGGADVYHFSLGMGRDVIFEQGADANELRIDAGVALINVTSQREGSDLIIKLLDGTTSARLKDYFSGNTPNWQIRYADGTVVPIETFVDSLKSGVDSVEKAVLAFKNSVLNQRAVSHLESGWNLEDDGKYHRRSDYTSSNSGGWVTRNISDDVVSDVFVSQYSDDAFVQLYASSDTTYTENVTSSTTYVRDLDPSQRISFGYGSANPDTPIFIPLPQSNGHGVSGVGYQIPAGWTPFHVKNNSGQFTGVWLYPPGYFETSPITGNPTEAGMTTRHSTSETIRQFVDFHGGDASNYIVVDDGSIADGGAGDDILEASGWANDVSMTFLYGNDGNDRLYGADGNDILIGGRGYDDLSGGFGADTYRIVNEDGVDYVQDDGDDFESYAEWFVKGRNIDDPELDLSTNGIWELYWDDGARNYYDTYEEGYQDILEIVSRGGHWETVPQMLENLKYYQGPDIESVAGNDYAAAEKFIHNGVIAADKVVFGPGVTRENLKITVGAGYGTLILTGPDGTGVEINLAQESDRIGTGIELVEFSDGTRMTMRDLITIADQDHIVNGTAGDDWYVTGNGLDSIRGGDGDDIIETHGGNDTLDGGAGTDYLVGGAGNDVFLFGRGSGNDEIYQYYAKLADVDVIRLASDILPSDVTLSRNEDALCLTINDTGDSITQYDWFEPEANRVTRVEFADGTVWDLREMYRETLLGTENGDEFDGNEQNSTLVGLEGADALYGNYGDDVLNGGKDDDYLDGGQGNDVYLFARGDGNDVIDQYSASEDDVDVIRFASDILPSDIVLSREENSGRITIKDTGDSILLQDLFNSEYRHVERIEFDNGTVWNMADVLSLFVQNSFGNELDNVLDGSYQNDGLYGGDGNDTLLGEDGNDVIEGGAGNDTLEGGSGNDIYLFSRGFGQDYISEGWYGWEADFIRFDATIAPADIVVMRDRFDLHLIVNGTSDRITIAGWFEDVERRIERIEFADGTLWNYADVFGRISTVSSEGSDYLRSTHDNRTLQGLGGNDVLIGRQGDDILVGGSGNDYLEGEAGNDTYYFEKGFGHDRIEGYHYYEETETFDTIIFGPGILPDDVIVSEGPESHLYLTLNGGADRIEILNWFVNYDRSVERIIFADGSEWDVDDIFNRLTAGETIIGTNGDDDLSGGAGNDLLAGGSGNDLLQDSSGRNLLDGGAGNDVLYGDGDANFIIGGKGDDLIDCYGVDVVIAFNAGDGADEVYIREPLTLSLGGGITADGLSLDIDGTDFILNIGSGDSIRLTYSSDSRAAVTLQIIGDEVRAYDLNAVIASFEDAIAQGTLATWSLQETLDTYLKSSSTDEAIGDALALTYAQNGSLDALTPDEIRAVLSTPDFGVTPQLVDIDTAPQTIADESSDVLQGGAGADTLNGNTGNNLFHAGSGEDTMTGGAANDMFIGGAGNDTIDTGDGSDVIAFNRGDGQDLVAASTGMDDTLSLGGGIRYADLAFEKNGNDLILDAGAGEEIIFKDWYADAGNQSVANLQIVIEGTSDYDESSTNELNNKKIAQFDFAGLINQFDQARAANPTLTSWALSSTLLNFHLGSSDIAAIGGDLAYQYAKQGNLSNVSLAPAQALLGNPQFGAGNQNLQPAHALQDLSPRLM